MPGYSAYENNSFPGIEQKAHIDHVRKFCKLTAGSLVIDHLCGDLLWAVLEHLQVSALVTMYSHEEDIDSAIEVFTQAIQWYQQFQASQYRGGNAVTSS